MMTDSVSAVFFPANPEALSFDIQAEAVAAVRAGLKLYSNGRQFALLPRPLPGWNVFGGGVKCAA